MATLKERHVEAMRAFTKVGPGSDPDVAAAIRKVHSLTTPSHSLGRGTHSLLRLIEEHLDGPVAQVMKRAGYSVPPVSELVGMGNGTVNKVLGEVALDALG